MEKYNNAVSHPSHYRHKSGVECKEITYDLPSWLGSAIKYIWRYQHKGKPVEDLRKAKECLSAYTPARMVPVMLTMNVDEGLVTKVHKVIDVEGKSLLGETLYIMLSRAMVIQSKDVDYLKGLIDDTIERLLEDYEGEMR